MGRWVRLRNEKRGVVRFVGNTKFAPGLWAGIELLYPEGRNCGVVDGERYFHCESNLGLSVELNYGIFVRPDSLRVLRDRNMDDSHVFSPVVSVASEKVKTTTTTPSQYPRPYYFAFKIFYVHLNMVRRRRNRYGLNFRRLCTLVNV